MTSTLDAIRVRLEHDITLADGQTLPAGSIGTTRAPRHGSDLYDRETLAEASPQ